MGNDRLSLMQVFDGWEGHQTALVDAIRPLTAEQLAWRPAPHLRSVGEVAGHISQGRLEWFERMQAPRRAEPDELSGADNPEETFYVDAAALVRHLDGSWHVIKAALRAWGVGDLAVTYRQAFLGRTYAVSRQWTIWRVLTHDMHRGGELALMLGLQGIPVPELGDQFGHLVMPPLAE